MKNSTAKSSRNRAPNHANTPIEITVYEGAKAPNPIAHDTLTWTELGDEIEALIAEPAASKETMRAIGPYRLREGATRANRNVERMAAVIALDVDHDLPDLGVLRDDIRSLGVAAIVYTSPSDPNPDGSRRARIFLLSEPHAPEQCWPVRRAAAALLGVTPDKQTKDPSRILFAGMLEGSADRECYRIDGEPLALAWLDLEANDPTPPPRPQTRRAAPSSAAPGERVEQVIEIVEPHYTENRHELVRALGSWLATYPLGAWSDAEIASVVRALPSDQTSKRVRDALEAATQARSGAVTIGWQTLSARLGPVDSARLEGAARSVWWVKVLERHAMNDTPSADASDNEDVFAPAADSGEDDDEPTRDDPRTDMGNARRLVRGYGDSLRYFEARKLWYVWDGSRWKADNTGEIVRAAKDAAESLWEDAKSIDDDDKRKAAFKWAAQCQDRARLMNMIELAKSEPGIPVVASDLDAHPWLLNVQNGTLDLRTGELHDPDAELLMTKCCATHYEPGARSELWEAFVKRTTGGDAELAAYIQRSLGYALFGAWREKAFWFGYGPPDGAKSTLLGAIGDVLGDYHVAAAASTWMVQNNVGGNRGDVTRLLGARFVTSLEIRPGLRFDEELVKKVTGGDTIVAAGKYENEIQFPPTFALWMGANDRPTIRDDDEGMWSRMRCVPFTNPVPEGEKDPHLREKLTSAEHAPAVLAWLVAGCLAWQRQGIGKCAAVTAATRAYRADMNRAGAFFEECCELGDGFETPAKAMRHAYDEWCKANGVRAPLSASALGQRLRGLGATGGDDTSRRVIQPATRTVGTIPGRPAVTDRFWFGVRLVE